MGLPIIYFLLAPNLPFIAASCFYLALLVSPLPGAKLLSQEDSGGTLAVVEVLFLILQHFSPGFLHMFGSNATKLLAARKSYLIASNVHHLCMGSFL
jgi:hypothetical protein